MKRIIAILMVALLIVAMTACGNSAEAPKDTTPAATEAPVAIEAPTKAPTEAAETATDLSTVTVGQNDVKFGNFTWRVLDVQDGKVLLLTEKIIEFRPYHKDCESVTWAESDLREYLNSLFITENFSEEEQKMLAETAVVNNDNPWFGVEGGEDTVDKVFLLSIEEFIKYFGDSGQLENGNPDSEYFIDDEYNDARIATYDGTTPEWWFLRSPGAEPGRAADVSDIGLVIIYGDCTNAGHGTRPAVWVNVE